MRHTCSRLFACFILLLQLLQPASAHLLASSSRLLPMPVCSLGGGKTIVLAVTHSSSHAGDDCCAGDNCPLCFSHHPAAALLGGQPLAPVATPVAFLRVPAAQRRALLAQSPRLSPPSRAPPVATTL